MAAAEESVKILSAPSLILFVIGTAEEADDINRYAIICKTRKSQLNKKHFIIHQDIIRKPIM